jgi:elongation factor Ts
MSDIIKNIKNLRETTGAGFLDCKIALEENNNEIEKSIDYLRKKGLAKATKKLLRTANEGAVGIFFKPDKTLLIEINTETDFAAKNEIFLSFIEQIASYALQIENGNEIDINKFINTEFENKKISEYFMDIIAKIGENIILKRLKILNEGPKTKIFTYTHNPYKENIGKICVALKTEIDTQDENIFRLGKNLCMHIAALNPLSIDIDDLDENLITKEKEIQLESIKSSGKPDNIIEKILEGKMKKFFSEVTLLNQKFILDEEKTVKEVILEFNSKNGNFKIIDYSLFILGSQ